MSTASKKGAGPLTEAAAAFERELAHYEQTTTELEKMTVSSEKTLNRTKALLDECAQSETRLSEHLSALATAMNASRDKQQACMVRSRDAAARVRERAAEFAALLEQFAALGQRAREVNEPVSRVIEQRAAGAGAADLLAPLEDVTSRMTSVIDDAAKIAETAHAQGWPDIAREAESLRQQVQAARNKVMLAQKQVAARAPS
jgi:hypothetical protein